MHGRGADHNRILYVITDPVSTRLLRGQLRHLVEFGFDVHLVYPSDDRAEALAQSEGVTIHRAGIVREPSPRADLHGLADLIRVMRHLRPAIVNASTPKAGLLGMLAARFARVPRRVYVVRGLRFETATGWRRAALRLLERVAMANATQVLFNSRSLRALAQHEGVIGTGHGIVLGDGSGNGVDASRFGNQSKKAVRSLFGIEPEEQVIGFVGRLTRDKGISDLLTAYTYLCADRPTLRLLLVGDFEEGDALDGHVQDRIRTDTRITASGWMEDPTQVYAAMDILVFPSYREGLPNVPLEAQASSVPVVGYAATGTVDAVVEGQTGVLVPIGDVRALTKAIAALLDDPSRRERMGCAGRRWVTEAFPPQRIWEELTTLYTTALR